MERSDDIKCITRNYWNSFEPSKIDEALRWYVCEKHSRLDDKSLLEAELDYARSQGRLTDRRCETLVLLVGFSLEPLLQSVCVYQPQKIVLILNEGGYLTEEWREFACHVKEAIDYLVERKLLSSAPQFFGQGSEVGYPTADNPSAMFQTLVEVLHDETDVMLDVTGGKKSMVSGAYLYAAYAGARISYVDFDEYDPKYRRPYGCSCKIGELDNPYQTFALRDWERVRALYEQYRFWEAQQVLTSILPAMKQVMPTAEQPIQTLSAFLEYYEKWDGGDYRGAKQAAQNLPDFKQPSAVTVLGDQWFEISGNDFTKKPPHFYSDSPALRAYVCDELARIRRLVHYNEDYRSAFLRAGGVSEIVMLARLVRLVTDPLEKKALLDALENKTPGANDVFKALRDPTGEDITIGKDRKSCNIFFGGAPTLTIPRPSPMNPWWKSTSLFNAENGWETFLTRRNELAHKYFSIPREWAEDAFRFVQANVEDFLGCPRDDLSLQTTALSWTELCDLCGLSRFLPPSLTKEA